MILEIYMDSYGSFVVKKGVRACVCVCKKVASKDSFVVEARESFWIRKYDCVKTKSVKNNNQLSLPFRLRFCSSRD